MNKTTVLFIGLFSAWADAATTIAASHYPQLREGNPRADPFLEAAGVLTGQALILYGGEKMKANPKITKAVALMPTIPPFYAAANNLAHIAVIKAQTYPWKTCPFLYSGK